MYLADIRTLSVITVNHCFDCTWKEKDNRSRSRKEKEGKEYWTGKGVTCRPMFSLVV